MTLMPIHIFVGVNIEMDLFVLLQMTLFIDLNHPLIVPEPNEVVEYP